MNNNLYILPYNQASKSAEALAAELGVKRIKKENSRFKGKADKVVINWGNRAVSAEVAKCQVLNKPEAITTCSDKLKFFAALKEKGTSRFVPFTTDKEEAAKWIADGREVMCRTILNGHSGQGLVIATTVAELVDAPLYTQYVPKKHEYRVHLFRGEVVTVQRKALAGGANENQNWKVRNLANGFIFARNEDKPIPDDVMVQAKEAFNSVEGLDFGSVDVIWNEYRKEAYVLEINTASGLTGTTVKEYADKFREVVG
jgi:glutathione synthase/RimK-type ligase-like ATP-grasp enzyme